MGKKRCRTFTTYNPSVQKVKGGEQKKQNNPLFKYSVRVSHKGVGRSVAQKTGGVYDPGKNTVTTGRIAKEYMQTLNSYFGRGIRSYKKI